MTTPGGRKRKVADAGSHSRESCAKSSRTNYENNCIVVGADPWARVAATANQSRSTVQAGRGSLSGWTLCPLCGIYSKKKYALGRGIANHLKDVHTPWDPSKLAQKIHRRQHERRERERQRLKQQQQQSSVKGTGCDGSNSIKNVTENEKIESRGHDNTTPFVVFKPLVPWTPTEEERKEWASKIVEILRNIDRESKVDDSLQDPGEKESATGSKEEYQNKDKSGKLAVPYRDSLPPFLMAASKGDLKKLKEVVNEAKAKDEEKATNPSDSSRQGIDTIQNNENCEKVRDNHLRTLLNTQDRHKSTADHWAAGGGHLECLQYLYNLRASLGFPKNHSTRSKRLGEDLESCCGKSNGKARRRDGKTCLHYAARNGHVNCMQYLLELDQSSRDNQKNLIGHSVDERSGEGTTPLHLACYGGHPDAVKHLIKVGADPSATNDWGCTCAHWTAMTLSDSEIDVRNLCGYLAHQCGVSFTEVQGQGHTALHKAAHRQNRHVIQWMADPKSKGGAGLDPTNKAKAGAPDLGGHKPSDIWKNMGGDTAFADWMKTTMGW